LIVTWKLSAPSWPELGVTDVTLGETADWDRIAVPDRGGEAEPSTAVMVDEPGEVVEVIVAL
jgi:hypothetical protein